MTQVTYPGVYIQELPSSVRTITSVTTSVTAFVGAAARGPIDEAVVITNFSDFERRFGGLDSSSLLSYGVQHFFGAGGSVAIIVRVAQGAEPATAELPGGGADDAFIVSSLDASAWGNGLRVAVDPEADSDRFGLRVLDANGGLLEQHRALSADDTDARYAPTVVNDLSGFIRLQAGSSGAAVPDLSGTVSDDLDTLPDLADAVLNVQVIDANGDTVETVDGLVPYAAGDDPPVSVTALGLRLERVLRAGSLHRSFTAARVNVAGNRLQVLAGIAGGTMRLTGQVANDLGLTSERPNQHPLADGADGDPPGDAELRGNPADKTGIYALLDVQDVNLLSLPDLGAPDYAGDPISVISAAAELCEDKRMFLIVDSPAGWSSVDAARVGLPAFDSVRSNHAALYFPHIQLTDPLSGQLRNFPPSGMVAGIMARTDGERGVWKAPAGTDARLGGVRALTVKLSDEENGLLNPLGLNCLRSFPVIGPVVWGARTLEGADALTSQWKYIPVRRLALMLEESLYRGLQWVVFEPNDEKLWGQIRLNVGAFMHTLFRQGAFQGTAARDAFFVKCDAETTTQDDINRGIVNIIVGFAPLKPAEFVIVKIEQMAGRIEV